MKLICDCGAVLEFVDGENGPSYTEGEGWCKTTKGPIDISETHDQVYFYCCECKQEIWVFT